MMQKLSRLGQAKREPRRPASKRKKAAKLLEKRRGCPGSARTERRFRKNPGKLTKREKDAELELWIRLALFDLRFHSCSKLPYSVPPSAKRKNFLYVTDLQITRHLADFWEFFGESTLKAPHLETVQKILRGMKPPIPRDERMRDRHRLENQNDARRPAWLSR